ncbi:MAG: hypothetical protein V4662_06190 [Verrucomicrobiota bacterium]
MTDHSVPRIFMRQSWCALLACVTAFPSLADEAAMVTLKSTPEEIGKAWGELNKTIILEDMQKNYLKKASAAKISDETLIKRAEEYVKVAKEVAPHWLTEAAATARAIGVDETLYQAFIDSQSRNRFLHECTSYSVSKEHTKDGVILFHKTRDNVDRPQVACIVQSSIPGIHKFITVSDASRIRCSMMVNEKGLAGSGDYPAEKKKDSSTLVLPPAAPQYRGVMAGSILRHIAERATTTAEALEIIQDFVKKGWYAGGDVNASHWLFVDREGKILEVANNSKHVVFQYHTEKVYFSRLKKSPAAQRLEESKEPIDFHAFRNVSRDKSICFGSSISGLTVEIDPAQPERLTCAWIALPARTVAFPLMMGQSATPAMLADSQVYQRGKESPAHLPKWEELERGIHASKEKLKAEIKESIAAGNPEETHVEQLDQWSAEQAAKLFEAMK